ncbi:hypothetical protein F2Q69_00054250 [Brassica cretica]|uniref:Uncharacterized protein n=1 Tax=Brassica cretica TaxID=69181 RepID=A0A8S9MPU8_BRACR|nr:hypothetical protein F2Q69_00054250 [Brassica cretica]
MNMARTGIVHRFLSPTYLFPSFSSRVVVEQACLRPGQRWRRVPASRGPLFRFPFRPVSAASSPFSPPIRSTSWARVLAPESTPQQGCIFSGGLFSFCWGFGEKDERVVFSLRRVWVLFLPCCVSVDLIITAASCGFEHACGWCSCSVAGSCSSLVLVGVRGFWSGCALVLIPVFAEACDGSSSNNFSSSVLVGYGCVVLCAGWAQVRSTVVATRFAWTGTLYRPCFEALSKLFSGGPLSLRADHQRSQNYWDSDSRLNLVHLFAASRWCGIG